MDDLDRAQKDMEILQSKQLENAHKQAGQLEVQATGFCLNCGEPVPEVRRWCCSDCRDEWEKRKKRGKS